MRPKIVFLIVAGAMLVVAGLVWIRPQNNNHARGGADGISTIPPASLPSRRANRIYVTSEKRQPGSTAIPNTSATPEAVEDAINARIIELSELATQGDSASFNTILAELTNSIPEIRQAALDAVIQSGNTQAIPVLKNLAEQSTDAHQVKVFREAIDFLTLPSLAEVSRISSARRVPQPFVPQRSSPQR